MPERLTKQYDSNEVGNALMAKLYSIVSGAELSGGEPLMHNKFVSWYCPGIPFTTDTFDYLTQGFVTAKPNELGKLYNGAQVISELFDRVPSVEGQFLDTLTETVSSSTADKISSVYKDVLRWSRVVDNKLSPRQEMALVKLRSLVSQIVDNIDPVAAITAELAGEEYVPEKITKNTAMYDAYLKYEQEYEDAFSHYRDHLGALMAAQSITEPNPEAIARITRAAHGETTSLQRKVDLAKRRWESHGHKSKIERIQALIKQITERSMVVYKDELQKSYDHSFVSNPQLPGSSPFLLTTLLPPNFDEARSWSKYAFSDIDMDSYAKRKTSKFSASAGAGFFGFGARAHASTSRSRTNNDFKMKQFKMEFELMQTPISRAGFEPGFFWMRGWDLGEMWDLNYSNKAGKRVPLSNGKRNPAGRIVAYPTSAIWIRNVKIYSKELASSYKKASKDVRGGGSAGWGPFRAKGAYSSSSTETESHYDASTGMLTIGGLQCIGTMNNLLPKCPNLHPSIKAKDLVGGEK